MVSFKQAKNSFALEEDPEECDIASEIVSE